jgi:hypothetical protein
VLARIAVWQLIDIREHLGEIAKAMTQEDD